MSDMCKDALEDANCAPASLRVLERDLSCVLNVAARFLSGCSADLLVEKLRLIYDRSTVIHENLHAKCLRYEEFARKRDEVAAQLRSLRNKLEKIERMPLRSVVEVSEDAEVLKVCVFVFMC